jgi:hypothetical protein
MSEKFSFPDDELNTELYESIKKELLKKKDEICRDRIENELMKVQEKEENLNHENNEKIEKLKKRIDLVKYESEISPSNASYFTNLEDTIKNIKLNENHVSDIFIDIKNSEASIIQFCFLVDFTDSMLPYLNEVKDFAKCISTKLKLFLTRLSYRSLGIVTMTVLKE